MDLIILIKAVIMGVVEGLTEFLPVSSTGHLIIAGELLNFLDKDKRDVFEVVIQLGAILAVIWEYRQRFVHTFANVMAPDSKRLIINIAVAFLPAAIIGVIFSHKIKELLFNPVSVAIALIIGGIAIVLIENLHIKPKTQTVDEMTWQDALKVGLAQVLALIPGTSRSGATIMGGMVSGLSRKTATEFSFFLAVPIMFAATFLDMYKSRDLFVADDFLVLAVGFVVSFIAALLAIRGLVRFVSNHDFKPFAYYRIIFGLIVLAYFWK